MVYANPRPRRWLSLVLTLAASVAIAAEAPDAPFYDELGGRQGIAALVDTFAGHLYADPRIGPFFAGVDPKVTRERLAAQFCDLAGGPCKTVNPDMRKTHSGMDIRTGDFDAVILILKQSMAECALSTLVQERLLRKLAPMQGAIVNTP